MRARVPTPRRAAAAIVVSCLTAQASAQVATEWSLQLQCRSSLNPAIAPFNLPFPSSLSSQGVAIDETGGVATRVVLGSPAGSEGIFYGVNGAGGLIVTINDPNQIVYSSDLDARNGRISMSLLESGNGAEVRGANGDLLQAFPAGGPQGVDSFSRVRLTDDGTIGYRGRFGFSGRKHIIDRFENGQRTQTLIADDLSSSPYSFLFNPTINNNLQMASKVLFDAGGQGIIRWDSDATPTTLVETGPIYNHFSNGTDLNDAGQVAFFGRRANDSQWFLSRVDDQGETVIATPGDLGIQSSAFANFGPAINNDGLVAFRAKDAAGDALFVGDGDTLVRVVGDGDVVETDLGPITVGFDFGGTTGRQALSGSIAINDAGQLGVALFLENGTIGVFVATPDGPNCPPDWNGDGVVDSDDLFDFLSDWAGGDADYNGDGVTDSDDLFDFLADWADPGQLPGC